MHRLILTALLLTLGISSAASASTVKVNFSFSSVTGVLTFNGGIGDTTADAVQLTSNNFGESLGSFSLTFVNAFAWSGSDVSTASFQSNGQSPGGVLPNFTLSLNAATPRYVLGCVGNLTECAGVDEASIVSSRASFETAVSAIPLPAGLPLLAAGLAALAGIGYRRKRAA